MLDIAKDFKEMKKILEEILEEMKNINYKLGSLSERVVQA